VPIAKSSAMAIRAGDVINPNSTERRPRPRASGPYECGGYDPRWRRHGQEEGSRRRRSQFSPPFEVDPTEPANSAMKTSTLAALLLTGLVALVAGKSTDVVKAGTCTKRSSSTLSLSNENGNLQVEFEVDMNVANRWWLVIISKNGKQVYKRNHLTNAASGSFDARKVILGGLTGSITAKATSNSTGEVCTAAAKYV
jgi:hypothetical protein